MPKRKPITRRNRGQGNSLEIFSRADELLGSIFARQKAKLYIAPARAGVVGNPTAPTRAALNGRESARERLAIMDKDSDSKEATITHGRSWDDLERDGARIRQYHLPGVPNDEFIDQPSDDSPQQFWRRTRPGSIFGLGSMKVPRAVSMWKHLSPGKRDLLRVLNWHGDGNAEHVCFASQGTMAAETGLSDRSVRRLLKEIDQDRMFQGVEARPGYTTRFKVAGAMNRRELSAAIAVQERMDAALSGGGPPAKWQPEHPGEEAAVNRWGHDRLPWLIAARDDMTAVHREAWCIVDRATFRDPEIGYTLGLKAFAAQLSVCERWAEKVRAYLVKVGRFEKVDNGPGRRVSYRTVKSVTAADVRRCEGWIKARGGWIDPKGWVWQRHRHPRPRVPTYRGNAMKQVVSSDPRPRCPTYPRPGCPTPPGLDVLQSGQVGGQLNWTGNDGGENAACPVSSPSPEAVSEAFSQMKREIGRFPSDVGPKKLGDVKRCMVGAQEASTKGRKPQASRAFIRSEIFKAQTGGDMVRALTLAQISGKKARELEGKHGLGRIKEVGRMISDTPRKGDGADCIGGFIIRALEQGWPSRSKQRRQ